MDSKQFCFNCGAENTEDAKFCSQCSKRLSYRADFSSVESFMKSFYGLLYHEKKYPETAALLSFYEENYLDETGKAELEQKCPYDWFDLMLLTAVADEKELELLSVAFRGEDDPAQAAQAAADIVKELFWFKIFKLKDTELRSRLAKMEEADQVLPAMLQALEKLEGITSTEEMRETFTHYCMKIDPYDGTQASKYISILQALRLDQLEEEMQDYAGTLGLWSIVLTDRLLDNAQQLHGADYLEVFRLDDETKRKIYNENMQNLLQTGGEYVQVANTVVKELQEPLMQLIHTCMQIRQQQLPEKEKNKQLEDLDKEFKTYEDRLFAEAKLENGVWTGGYLDRLQQIFVKQLETETTGAEFFGDFITAVLSELRAHGVELRPLIEYFVS